jgi:hypothetical protein
MQWAQPATRLIMHVAPWCDALRSGCAGLRAQPVPASQSGLRGPEASQREQLLRTSQELLRIPTSQLSVVGSLIFRPGTPCAGPDFRAQAKQLCVPRVVGAAWGSHVQRTLALASLGVASFGAAPRSADLPYLALPPCLPPAPMHVCIKDAHRGA